MASNVKVVIGKPKPIPGWKSQDAAVRVVQAPKTTPSTAKVVRLTVDSKPSSATQSPKVKHISLTRTKGHVKDFDGEYIGSINMAEYDGELPEQDDNKPVLQYEKTIRINHEKLSLFRKSMTNSSPSIMGNIYRERWFPVAKIATPEFKLEAYNTQGKLRLLNLEIWIHLDKDENGNHSLLPMLIDNYGKEENGTGTAVSGTHPTDRLHTMPEFFVFFYGGVKITLHVKEKA